MTTLVSDVSGDRVLGMDAENPLNPDSIFLFSGQGFCIELDREDFLRTVLRAYGLRDVIASMEMAG